MPRFDGSTPPRVDFPWPRVRTIVAGASVSRETGVPRRFSVGILLIITSMYSVLFSVLKAFRIPLDGFVVVSLFLTAVGVAQMLLFKGQRPRRASVIAGACFLPILFLGVATYEGMFSLPAFGEYVFLIALTIGGGLAGALNGYVAGYLIALVFLVIDKLQAGRKRK